MRRRWRKPRNASSLRHEEMIQVCLEEEAKPFSVLHTAKADDVGFDVYTSADTVIPPGAHLPPTEVPLGIRIKLPEQTWAMFFPRSGTYNHFPSLLLCQAPIDNGYTGALTLRFKNISAELVLVRRGTRLAQLVVFPMIVPKVVVVSKLPETARGGAKYGSTGK